MHGVAISSAHGWTPVSTITYILYTVQCTIILLSTECTVYKYFFPSIYITKKAKMKVRTEWFLRGKNWAHFAVVVDCCGTPNPKCYFDLLLFHLVQGLTRPEKILPETLCNIRIFFTFPNPRGQEPKGNSCFEK